MGMAVEVPAREVWTSSALPAASMASQAPGVANAVPLATVREAAPAVWTRS